MTPIMIRSWQGETRRERTKARELIRSYGKSKQRRVILMFLLG